MFDPWATSIFIVLSRSYRNGNYTSCSVTKMGRFNPRPSRKVSPSYRFLLARSHSAIHIDFALVVVYRRRKFGWPLHSPGGIGQKRRRVRDLYRYKRESTEYLINGEGFSKDRLYIEIFTKKKLKRRRKGKLKRKRRKETKLFLSKEDYLFSFVLWWDSRVLFFLTNERHLSDNKRKGK